MFAFERRAQAHHHRWSIWRSSTDKMIGGVCGGLGAHYGVSVTALRLSMVIVTLLTFPLMFVVYGLCVMFMPIGPTQVFGSRRSHVTPPPIPHYAVTHADLTNQYDEIEARIRLLEDLVTSREYVLKRKFESL